MHSLSCTPSSHSVANSYDPLTLVRLGMGDCFSVTAQINVLVITNTSLQGAACLHNSVLQLKQILQKKFSGSTPDSLTDYIGK